MLYWYYLKAGEARYKWGGMDRLFAVISLSVPPEPGSNKVSVILFVSHEPQSPTEAGTAFVFQQGGWWLADGLSQNGRSALSGRIFLRIEYFLNTNCHDKQ